MALAADETEIEALLGQADALVADGHAVDALELVAERRRREHDDRLDAHLVRLRNAAFDEVRAQADPGPWPPPIDPSLHTDGPPVITPDQLSADMVRYGVFRHGSVWIKGLVGADDLARLRGGIDEAFDHMAAARADGAPGPWYDRLQIEHENLAVKRRWAEDADAVWMGDSPRNLSDYVEVLDRVGLRQVIGEFLGERPAMSLVKLTMRRVDKDAIGDWHQDGAFMGPDIRSLNVWVALTDCGVDAPGMDIVPQRIDDILPTGTDGAIFDWAVSRQVIDEVCEGVWRPQFEAGDVLLFDQHMVHSTAREDDMTGTRYAIESWFFAPSVYPETQVPLIL